MGWKDFVRGLGFKEGVVSGAAIAASLGTITIFLLHYFALFDSQVTAAWAAAIATTSAAGIALWLGLADIRRRSDERERKSRFLLQATAPELRQLDGALGNLMACLEILINGLAASFNNDRPYSIPELTSMAIDASAKKLSTPMLDKLWLDLKDIEDDLGLDAAYVATELPRIVEWVAMLPKYPELDFDEGSLFAHARLAAERSADVGIRVCKILRKTNPNKSDRQYQEYLDREADRLPY